MKMTVYRGVHALEVDVTILDGVAGEIDCIECGGDGDWKKFLNADQIALMCPGDAPYPCVECKGTGRTLVTI